MIPKIFHTVWPGSDYERLPDFIGSWVRLHPLGSFMFWTLDNRPKGLFHVTNNILDDTKLHPVIKSDLYRLEVLRLFGGVYKDADMECLRRFDDLMKVKHFCGSGIPGKKPPNALIGCEPDDALIVAAIRDVIGGIINNKSKIIASANPYTLIMQTTYAVTSIYLDQFSIKYPHHFFYNVSPKPDDIRYTRHHCLGGRMGGWVSQIKKPVSIDTRMAA